jgi:glycosyltransferase involved in cell wall biosynthesis
MRIAFIVPSLANKGPIIVVKHLCEYLVYKGHNCKVFYFDDICELSMPCTTKRIFFMQKIDFTQWDIIHSHMLRPDLWVFVHKSWFGKCFTKFVTTVHQDIIQTLTLDYGVIVGFFIGNIWKFILKKFDRVVVMTNEHIKTLSEVRQNKISVIFNGRDIDFKTMIDQGDGDIISVFRSKYKTLIGTNSIITKRKGLEQIIKALPILPNVGYVVVGDGPEQRQLKQLAKQLGVENQCLWLGVKANGYRYTALFDVYLIVSRSEGFPLSLIEAAAWVKPTICSDIPVFRSIVNSKQVTFVTLDDPVLLAQTINEVVTYNHIKENALNEFYYTALTSEIMSQNYINLYESL